MRLATQNKIPQLKLGYFIFVIELGVERVAVRQVSSGSENEERLTVATPKNTPAEVIYFFVYFKLYCYNISINKITVNSFLN